MTEIKNKLKWKDLRERRKNSRIILFYKGIHGHANIPLQDLQIPARTTKHHHPEHYKHIQTRTDTLKYSFIPATIKDWDNLDYSLVS